MTDEKDTLRDRIATDNPFAAGGPPSPRPPVTAGARPLDHKTPPPPAAEKPRDELPNYMKPPSAWSKIKPVVTLLAVTFVFLIVIMAFFGADGGFR